MKKTGIMRSLAALATVTTLTACGEMPVKTDLNQDMNNSSAFNDAKVEMMQQVQIFCNDLSGAKGAVVDARNRIENTDMVKVDCSPSGSNLTTHHAGYEIRYQSDDGSSHYRGDRCGVGVQQNATGGQLYGIKGTYPTPLTTDCGSPILKADGSPMMYKGPTEAEGIGYIDEIRALLSQPNLWILKK